MKESEQSGRWSTFWFWTLLHAKRSVTTKLLIIGIGMPALLSFGSGSLGVVTLNTLAQGLVTGLLPLMALLYGSGVIREEIEQQTLTYSLIRPLPRQLLYASRVLAAALPLAACVAPALIVMSSLSDGRLGLVSLLIAATLGSLAYVALFALVGQFARRPLGIGLIFMVWESGASKVPGFFGEMTLTRHVGVLAGVPGEVILSGGAEIGTPIIALVCLIALTLLFLMVGAQVTARRGFTLPR